mmetsp:Transcript_23734/g.22766  ORF Transcript_23734/g.22766 Transcript_23734/m.22766 type:complete len:293 (+) Transcript_23734:73-951(+)|eukprot:CAMPEP_0197826986 /NCGR_PEP_ID=MMETSP1437-20131217/3868_1 /TAXON_ID=49252 ORGANISM="Eucampia antarctica, Strain CCMP1452" /NCGR_SAMPLE_ID=MMETSP1437 /ASSEMBLY_ACC=CAM_ASM_001096 /LENGTH=292 /DNA_ID=CAMNT_0043427665 /DNA_START=229 /DNA_END=1107 /DNA_ORIENTATION=+
MKASLPSSLTCPPTRSLSKVEDCQFYGIDDFQAVPLLEKIPVSSSSFVLRFGLPDATKSLQLSTCSCMLAKATINNGEDEENVVRPYTPISVNTQIGTFDLLVKRYENGTLSKYMCDDVEVNSSKISFRQIPFNIKLDASEFVSSPMIVMLAGGTGITPMIQALHAILGSDDNDNNKGKSKVVLVYGSRDKDDILAQELLDQWSKDYPQQLTVTHVLSDSKDDNDDNTYRKGFVTKSLLEEVITCPIENVSHVMVCGPPPMYEALCGPRTETDVVRGVLADMGFTAEQVYKF